MYAIVNVAGRQFKAEPGATLRVPRLPNEVGTEVTIEQVLVWSDGSSTELGQPFVDGKSITAEVVRHGKDRKVLVYKKKRRKKYRRKVGHRQLFTELRLGSF